MVFMIRAVNDPYQINYLKLSNGCNLAYIDEGTGPETLLFVHGLATYGLSWRKNIEYLKQYYRCIAIDLPGNGFSDRGDYPYGINFFAGAVYDFMRLMKLEDVSLVGHSMGGQVAMTTVLRQPDCAKKLVLCAPAGFEQFSAIERGFYNTSLYFFDIFSTEENSLRKTIRSSFYLYPSQADDMINELTDLMKTYPTRTYRRMIEACIAGMLGEPVYDELHLIKQPTLVIFGERDALIPNKLIHPVTTKQVAEEGVRKMPNASLRMIPQCGHFLQWEQAYEVNHMIRQFIG